MHWAGVMCRSGDEGDEVEEMDGKEEELSTRLARKRSVENLK
jgi:hypothetical protein